MRHRRYVLRLLAIPAVSLAACNPFSRSDPVTEVTRNSNANMRWVATVVTPSALSGAVEIRGDATMAPGEKDGNTEFTLNLSNATPGGVHPWEVRRGQCGMDEGSFGSRRAYKAIQINKEGRGRAEARTSEPTPTSGRFYVTVSASSANEETIVACGNLAAPVQ